jgi:hypothetical protein
MGENTVYDILSLFAYISLQIAGSGAGSESGSVGQKYGSPDPDPYQRRNVTDPQHTLLSYHVVDFLL